MASDVAIIPCTPSPYDVWASKETVDLVKDASLFKENLKCYFTINRKITNTAIGRDVVAALDDMDVEVLTTHVSQRIVFAEAASSGRTVFDVDEKSKAANEIILLVDQILSKGGCNGKKD